MHTQTLELVDLRVAGLCGLIESEAGLKEKRGF